MPSIIRDISTVLFGTLALLLIPLIAMQFVDGMVWDTTDFIVMGGLLFISGLLYMLLSRVVKSTTQKVIVGTVVFLAFLLIWADLAVGIFNIPGFSGS